MDENPNEEFLAAIDAAAKEYEADLYLYSGPISDEGYGKVVTAITKHKVRNRAILILTTNGGSANVAYQIARIFQQIYPNQFLVCAPSTCKSAGTLVACIG